MIKKIGIKNFKSLRNIEVQIGRFNLFIGSNASGKSNFFDALRVLQGIGYGFAFSEILDGKPKGATSEVWEGIRGGSAQATCATSAREENLEFIVSGRFEDPRPADWEYWIVFSARDGRLRNERFHLGAESNPIFDSSPIDNDPGSPFFEVRYYKGEKGRQPHLQFEKVRPVLVQLAEGGNGKWSKAHAEVARRVTRVLSDMQRLDPSPSLLRNYSTAHQIQRMGERGENFAALIQTLCGDPKIKEAYESWLRELRPHEVEEVGTLRGAVGEPLFMLKENGREYPAPVLSDGTLRFAAIAAAFFQRDMPALLTIEEIENGIHASRLRLLVELLRNRSMTGRTQLMATTHSPIVLAWLKPEEYATTFFCKRDEETGESTICPLPEVPNFLDMVNRQPISDLFAEGWIEAAL